MNKIYKIDNNQNLKIIKDKKYLEKDIQSLIVKNSNELLNITNPETEFVIDMTKERIDIFGISNLDGEEYITIVEIKAENSDSKALQQAYHYFLNIKNNKKILHSLSDKKDVIDNAINNDRFRIICYANKFHKYDISTASGLSASNVYIELYEYTKKEGIFNTNLVHSSAPKKTGQKLKQTDDSRNVEKWRKLWKKEIEQISLWSRTANENIQHVETQLYDAFKLSRNIFSITFNKEIIRIYFNKELIDMNELNLYKDKIKEANKGHWGTGNSCIEVKKDNLQSLKLFIEHISKNN